MMSGMDVPLLEVLHALPMGVIITDTNFNIKFVNRWIEDRSGRSIASLVGRHIADAFPELKQRNRLQFYERALKGETLVISQRFHRFIFLLPPMIDDPSVSNMLQSVRIVPLWSGDTITGTVTFIEDVTERTLRERELQNQAEELRKLNLLIKSREEEYRTIVENTGDVIFVLDKDFMVHYVSPSVKRVFGKNPDDFINTSWLLWLSPEDAKKILTLTQTAIEKPQQDLREPLKITFKENGKERYFDVTVGHVLKPESQVMWILSLREITYQVELERQLKSEREFIEKVLQTVASLVVVLDTEGRIVVFNQACEKVSGFSAEEVLGKSVWEILIPEDEKESVKRVFHELRFEAIPNQYENHWITKDGGRRLISWKNSVVSDEDGKPLFIIGTGTDVTEQRRMEEELVASRMRLASQLEAIQKQNRILALLGELAEGIIISKRDEDVKRVLRLYLVEIFAPHLWSIYILDREKMVLTRWVAGGDGRPLPAHEWIAAEECWALQTGRFYECHRESLETCLHGYDKSKGHIYCVPISYQMDKLGVLSLFISHDTKSGEKQFFKEVMETVSRFIGLGFWNFRLRMVLREQSVLDPLTGLYNRRYLNEYLKVEYHRAVRSGMPISFLMLDIDHFKNINDTYGHPLGDEVLKNLANIIRGTVRLSDVICRYGGEEFLIICPDMDIEVASKRAEVLRSKVEQYILPIAGGITVSVGVATFPRHGNTLEKVIEKADEALYKAKKAGRNRVVIAEFE